jgi:predicted amidohydrolase YtcJ
VIRRRAGSREPDGVLEETAFFAAIVRLMGDIGEDGARAFAKAGSELWARYGYTTAEEGRSMPGTVHAAQKVADEGGFAIDVVTYVDVLVDRDFITERQSEPTATASGWPAPS